MGASVGEIDLDLRVNQSGFNRQLKGIQAMAKNVGAAIASAFAVRVVINFGKTCISTATEVENGWVGLNSIINGQGKSFNNAKKFIQEYISDGLVPLKNAVTAYKNLSLRGYNEEQIQKVMNALKNSATYARQSQYSLGDAISTATEGLKNENSIVVDNAGVTKNVAKMWEDYAKSIGVSYTSLTKEQKIQAEVNGILEETKFQMGDAEKYANTYSGKVAKLSASFTNLKVKIGNILKVIAGAFIPVINNAIKVVEKFIDGITALLNSFGIQTNIVDTLKDVSETAEGSSNNIDGITESAKEAEKAVNRLMGFDEINLLSKSNNSGGNNPVDMDISSIGNGGNEQISKTTDEAKEMSTVFDEIIGKVKELTSLFKQGFKIGVGDMSVFDSIRSNISSVKDSFMNVFTDGEVLSAANNLLNSISLYLGKHLGAITSVGATVADFFTGSIAKYLDQNKNFIKEKIISIFNIKAEILDIIGDLEVAIADIFTVFRGDTAKQIGSDLVEIFANSFLEIVEISEKLGRDIINCIAKPIIDNKDAIKQAMQGTLEAIQEVTGTIANFVSDTWKKIEKLYDEHIKPFFDAIAEGISSIVATLLKNYNQYIVPLLKWIGDKFTELVEKHISPMVDKILNFVGKVIDALKDIWNNVLVPFINWIINTIVPKIVPIVKTVVEIVSTGIGVICDVIGGIMDVLSGIIDFITGVFTGDWKKAWNGVKEIFSGIWDALSGIVKGALNLVIDVINWAIEKINKALTIEIPDWDILPDSIQGKSYSFEIPTIPKLAQGGFVEANTPQLAMIGDNTKYGEIVAPENKLSELLDKAVSKGGTDEETLYKAFLRALKDMPSNDVVLNVDGVRLGNAVAKGVNKITKANGGICPIIT